MAEQLIQQTAFQKLSLVYNRYSCDGIIDLDRRLKERPEFQVYRLEDIVSHVGYNHPPCRQTPYSMTLVLKGRGEKCIDHYTVPVEDDTLFIVPSRVVHSSSYLSTGCSGYLLSFNVDFMLNNIFSRQCILNRKALKSSVRPFCKLNTLQRALATEIFEHLLVISEEGGPGMKEMMAIKVLELLIHCDQLFDQEDTNGKFHTTPHPVVEKFMELLGRKFHLERGVQYYADVLNIHPNYLNFLLKKYLGLSTKECIDRRLITESKYLLINPALRVKEVAHQLGFDDPNNFSTFFQKHAGSSPLGYRSSNTFSGKI